MTSKLSALPAALALLLMLTIGTSQAAGQQAALTVEPTTLDFGNVLVGESAAGTVTLTNNTLDTLFISLEAFNDPNGVFILPLGFSVEPGVPYDMSVWFYPSSAGLFVANPTWKYSGSSPFSTGDFTITLVGRGEVEIENDPVVLIGNLLQDASALTSSDFAGPGKGKSAVNRLRVFVKWIEMAETLILAGEFDEAYELLSAVLLKVDGAFSPPDWVVGTAAEEVADQIQGILAVLAG
ncbi:hypothetical protein ACFL6T_03315 [Candidatus Zixiibacteriota bacterium]